MTMKERYEIVGDLAAPKHLRNVTDIYRKFSKHGIGSDESDIYLNWRVINKETGITLAVMGGSAGLAAAEAFKKYCEENY